MSLLVCLAVCLSTEGGLSSEESPAESLPPLCGGLEDSRERQGYSREESFGWLNIEEPVEISIGFKDPWLNA